MNINNLNHDCLNHLFEEQFALQELLPLRPVCQQWKSMIDSICAQKRLLKLFANYHELVEYCGDLPQIDAHDQQLTELEYINSNSNFKKLNHNLIITRSDYCNHRINEQFYDSLELQFPNLEHLLVSYQILYCDMKVFEYLNQKFPKLTSISIFGTIDSSWSVIPKMNMLTKPLKVLSFISKDKVFGLERDIESKQAEYGRLVALERKHTPPGRTCIGMGLHRLLFGGRAELTSLEEFQLLSGLEELNISNQCIDLRSALAKVSPKLSKLKFEFPVEQNENDQKFKDYVRELEVTILNHETSTKNVINLALKFNKLSQAEFAINAFKKLKVLELEFGHSDKIKLDFKFVEKLAKLEELQVLKLKNFTLDYSWFQEPNFWPTKMPKVKSLLLELNFGSSIQEFQFKLFCENILRLFPGLGQLAIKSMDRVLEKNFVEVMENFFKQSLNKFQIYSQKNVDCYFNWLKGEYVIMKMKSKEKV